MSQIAYQNYYIVFKILIISCIIVLISFLWQGNKGFNLWDEGFLWYGVQRVLLGEVPIRDFMAYDPGRYYWSAALIRVFGDNDIMSLRAAVATFQALGLFIGLFLVASSRQVKSKNDIIFLFFAASIFIVWMFPRHKLFDISISIFLIGILTYLVSNPILKRYFITGVCIGLVAVFGRNHGVYGVLGSMGAIIWISIQNKINIDFIKNIGCWGMGVMVGFSPIILMLFFVPNFGIAFWESICFLFEYKATNLHLPIPWPWTGNFTVNSVGDIVRGILIGLFFIGTIVFAILSPIWVVYQKLKKKFVPPAVVASAFLASPYAHYAFSRADISHLAHGIFPLLIGCLVLLALPTSKFKWPFIFALSASSIWVMHVFHPGWQCLTDNQCIPIEISNKQLQVDQETANNINLIYSLNEQFSSDGRTFIVAPFWPGAYAVLERKSPMWEIYALFPRTKEFEKKEIERIKIAKPDFALIIDIPLDGRNELRFKNTHPLTYQYVLNNFHPISISKNSLYQVYKAQIEK